MRKGYHDLFCIKCFLLVFMTVNILNAFDLQCPSSKQWMLRANSMCFHAEGYICLYDENMKTFAEICRNKSYVNPPGYKFVIVGNLFQRKCENSRYQPLTFSTYGGSTCIFEKTYCSGKGQIIFNNGSTNSDRQCRCDYSRGYDFITKPKHGCYCVPSIEDCSCYQKPCTPGFILSPGIFDIQLYNGFGTYTSSDFKCLALSVYDEDYKCINPTSWNSKFTCESILPYHSTDTNFPSLDNNLDDGVTAPTRNARIILSIAIGVTILFTLIIVQLKLFCLTKMEEGKHFFRENIELKLVLAGEIIPQNIRDLQKATKNDWQEQFSRFVETGASKDIFERIKEEQCVIIAGPFGCGKSSLAFHTALKLEETLEFDFMIISSPDDLIKYASKDKKQIFLIDDAFGKYNVSKHETIWWNAHGESVHQLVTRNTNLRLLMTSRINIYRSLDLPQLKKRFCLLNLISKDLALTFEERQMIGQCYLQEDSIDKLKDVIMTYSFFPMLCGMFSTYSNENIVEYFTNPVEFIKTEIAKFKQSSPDMFYLSLAVLVVFDNNVRKDIFFNNNHTYDRMLTSLSKGIGYKRYLSKELLYSSFIALTDSYVSDQDTHFVCLHSKLYNALAFCLGPRIAQDKYLERILLDMKTAVHNIFKGSQHLSAEFRELYIAYMKKHLKKEDLKNDIDETTVLHFVSEEGYEEYVDFFLKLDNQMVKCLDNIGQTALHKTCIKGHVNAARLLLDNSIDINRFDNDSKTALDIACQHDLNEMVDFLLSRDAQIRQKNTDGRSPLHVACKNVNFTIVKLLLKNNAKVNNSDCDGYTPLFLACEKGSFDIAKMLISHKAIIDIKNLKQNTSLYIACKKGHCDIVNLLLFNEANANNQNSNQNTPILIACKKKHIEIIRLLLQYKADINCKDKALLTPLHVACSSNNMDLILLLIKHGALVNEQDTNKQTPLFKACSKGYHIAECKIIRNKATTTNANQNSEMSFYMDDNDSNGPIVKVLLNAGANVNQGDSNEITPMHLACTAQRDEIVKMLINAGVDVNKGDKNGITPLDIAREGGRKEIISMILTGNVNANKSESTPTLHTACMEGNESLVKTLLNEGATVNEIDKDGLTPLHVACKGGQKEVVKMLINAGVNVNKGDKHGVTPLHMACIEGNESIVKVLLNSVANVKTMDKNGMTPMDVANKHGHNDIAALLLNTGAYEKGDDSNREITTLHMADERRREVSYDETADDDVLKDYFII